MSVMSKKKLQKKQERAKEVKKKILARRDAIRAPRIEENKQRKKAKRISKLMKDMGELNMWADDVLMKMDNNTISQLEKNAQLLKGLESEYEKERNKKSVLQDELNKQGLLTLEQKLNHLHQELVDQQKAAGESILDPELIERINRPRKEVSEVTIIRASDLDPKEIENKEILKDD